MSDYFGALMRSSAMTVAGGTARASADTHAGQGSRAPDPRTVDPSADVVEMTVERQIDPPPPGTARAPSSPGSAPAARRPDAAPFASARSGYAVPPAGDAHPAPDPAEMSRMHRAAIGAALEWIAADPNADRAGAALDVRGPRAAESAARARDANTVEPGSGDAAGHRADGTVTRERQRILSVQEIEIVPSASGGSIVEPISMAADRPASATAEDVVEVSIGAMHVHVDGVPPKTKAQSGESARSAGTAARAARSGLERRYLRTV